MVLLDFIPRGPVTVNRDAKFHGNAAQAADVIAVFVRDENAVQTFRRAANAGQPLADLPRAEAGVNQQPRLVRFQVGAIAGGTAAQDGQLN
jgi:hypothetical protein